MRISVHSTIFFVMIAGVFLMLHTDTRAAALSFVSDLVSTSAPSASADHTIQFTATNAIPASGHIVITPQASVFTIPSGLSFEDVDVAVSSEGNPFEERSLAPSPSATEDGISVTSGNSGSVRVTLNSTEGVAAGSQIRIKVGAHAEFGETGGQQIVHPSSPGSYRMRIVTEEADGSPIDSGATMIAVVDPVAGGAIVTAGEATLSNGLPSGEIAPGSTDIEISLNSVVPADCRYSTQAEVPYASMTNTFSLTGGVIHAVTIGGHEDDSSYEYHVRCLTEEDVANSSDFTIAFSIAPAHPPPTPSSGVVGSGGAGSFPRGSSALFLSSISLSGWSAPLNTISVLRDGVQHGTTQAGGDGSFQYSINGIERGTHSFSIRATDSQQRESGLFSSTLTVGQGTQNTVADIILPPTIDLEEDMIEIGEGARIAGEGVPGSTIEVVLGRSGETSLGGASKFTATTTTSGTWEIVVDPSQLSRGTYEVKARTIMSELSESNFSRVLFLGVGEEPSADLSTRANINGDDEINLVDFSILLSSWGSGNSNADINGDGIVNLADVSILLFHWTG